MDAKENLIPEVDESGESIHYSFDEDFQNGLASLALRDTAFMRRCSHLLVPNHFDDIGNAGAVQIALRHFRQYGSAIDRASLKVAVADAIHKKIIGDAEKKLVVDKIKEAFSSELPASAPLESKLAEFARHQAVTAAILKSADSLNKDDFDGIEKAMKQALDVGVNEEGDAYDYYAEIESRTQERRDKVAGIKPPKGITTGVMGLDDLLYHRGWGRKELSVLMAKAKGGKSGMMVNFAANASRSGFNVLYATLEVSARIISERLDAYISDTAVRELEDNITDVEMKIRNRSTKSGRLVIHEFPSGSMTPRMLRNLIEKYRNRGIVFDLVVVDYADIMAPDFRTDNVIENSKEIYVGLRAIAFEFDCALLTATQSNREGVKAQTIKAEHVAEDFNKIRTADIVISINSTEEEQSVGEARLYFAASRNQESGFTVRIKQDIKKMAFITQVVGIE
jgi:replicative DNA helicase